MKKNEDRVTRMRLREMQPGESITVECVDGYDMYSQKNTAYTMKRLEGKPFSCKSSGLTLTVTYERAKEMENT